MDERVRGLRGSPSQRQAWLLVALIFAAHAVANLLWVGRDLTLRSQDAGPHLEVQAHLYYLVRQHGLPGLWMVLRGGGGGSWPTAAYLPWVLLDLLCGQHLLLLRLSNLAYLAVALGSTYTLGARLHSAPAGVVAAALLSLYPAVYGEGRQFGLDYPGMALAALALALLLGSERFRRPGPSLGFGLALGAALLLRPHLIFFFAAPTLVSLGGGLLQRRRGPGAGATLRPLAGAVLALGVAAAVSGLWWWGNLGRLAALARTSQQRVQDMALSEVLREPSALFYLRAAPWCFSLLLLLALGVACVGLARPAPQTGQRPRAPADRTLLLAWLAGGLLTLLGLRYHFLRLLLPLCPAVAALTAAGLLSLRHRRSRRALVGIFLAGAAGAGLLDSFAASAPLHHGLERDPLVTRAYPITSGPPARNPILAAARRAAARLQPGQPLGHGGVVRLTSALGDDALHFFWLASAPLRLAWPGLRLTGVVHSQEYLGYAHRIGGASLPALQVRPRQCHVLSFDEAAGPAPQPPRPGARLLYQEVIDPGPLSEAQLRLQTWWLHGYLGRLRLSLWGLRRCPAEILQPV